MRGKAKVQVECKICGKQELVFDARSKKYKTCSKACVGKWLSETTSTKVELSCEVCGLPFLVKPYEATIRKTCSKSCLAVLKKDQMSGDGNHQFGVRGEKNSSWKGGLVIKNGYAYVYVGEGHHDYRSDYYIKRSRFVVEKHLGRKLSEDEHVHHINENKLDDSIENLQVMSMAEHIRQHNLIRQDWRNPNTGKLAGKNTVFFSGNAPTQATTGSAGFDIKAKESTSIFPGEIKKVPTGIKTQMPPHMCALLFIRSGISLKGISLANSVAVIDRDFTGEWMVLLKNSGSDPFYVSAGDRVAQAVFIRYEQPMFIEGNPNDTERGAGGFGSTGR